MADTAAIGPILIPAMKDEGYDADFSAAVTVSSSVVGPIIPPSIPAIVVGSSLAISIGGLFAGTMVPGILVGLSLMVISHVTTIKRKYKPAVETFSLRLFISTGKDAFFALLMPIIILGGILSGVFTATEAGAVASAYAVLIGFVVYKSLDIHKLYSALCEACIMTSVIMLIVGMFKPFGWILGVQLIPQKMAIGMLKVTENPAFILLMIKGLFLTAGMFIETAANILILGPILLPTINKIGIHPFHFGAILIINLVIGLITPPLGLCLYVASPLAEIPVERVAISVLPFFAAEIVVLLLVTYLPAISLFMPKILGFI